MSKEADEESKIAKVGRSGGPYRRTSRYASKGQRGAYQNNSGGQSSNPNFQPSRGNGNFQRSGSVSFLLASFLESGKKYPPVGRRLLQFVSAWRSVSHDPFILEAVSYGMTIDFVDTPYQENIPPNCAMSKEMEQACDLEISELLTKHAIVPVLDSSAGFYSSIFFVPKKTGGFRPIINLKRLNSFVRYEHFKLESMESVRHLIRQGDWMVKLDLKDAYLSVPIHVDHQHYLRFSWRGFRYQFSCLPFGLSPAPRLFTKLLKPVVVALRRLGIRLVIYLDDLIILSDSKEGALRDLDITVGLLTSLGFLVNWDKSVLDPSRSIEFLGLLLDSVSLSLALPPEKVSSLLSLCRRALDKGFVSLHDLSSLLGSFSWAIPTVPFAHAHYRNLQSFFISRSKCGDLSKVVVL